jgi:hypothetical protein
MTRTCGCLAIVIAAMLANASRAAEPCRSCGPARKTAAGAETPYGDTGCGPRYWGAVHEEPACPDPCDCCVRWRGCHGTGPSLEKFPPWQLPPGRGFVPAEGVGYETGPCAACQTCGPRWTSLRFW